MRHNAPGVRNAKPRAAMSYALRFRGEGIARPNAAVLTVALPLMAFFTGCATAPVAYREPAPLAATARTTLNREVFETAWRLIHEKYFDPQFRGVNWPAMRDKYRPAALAAADDAQLYHVLGQMCGELRESHLTPLAPRRSHEIRTEHRMAVGMVWRILDGKRVVTDVVTGGPAAEAGVKIGWVITARNDQPLDDSLVFLPQNDQPVTYTFLDLENQARTIEFKPQLLKIEQLAARDLPGGYRYLRFDKFDAENLHWLSEELKQHRRTPGIVLDLRDNPGGYVVAVQLAISEFFRHRVPTGEFIRRSGRASNSRGLSFLSARYPGRVVVLTSGATGSAAEIFAHVLQHQGRATIVGRRTAGAVIVARYFPLPGGGQLQVPVQDYRGLDGRRLEGRGVIPDIGVPLPALDDLRHGRDLDLETALAALDGTAPSRRDSQPELPIAALH